MSGAQRTIYATILLCYVSSLVLCVVWLATDLRWSSIVALVVAACGVILHVAEALLGDDA